MPSILKAGELNRRIRIEYKSATQDATYGTETIVWRSLVNAPGSPTVAASIPAQVQDVLPGRSEAVRQGLEVARNQTRIRIRYRSDVDAGMRIVVLGDSEEVFQIVGGPSMLGRKEGLEMVCERFSTAGGNG